MMMISERLIAEAISAQEDNRYGNFTNPFILGLLTAADLVEREHTPDMAEVTFTFRNPTRADPRNIAKLEALANLLFGNDDTIIDISGMKWSAEQEELEEKYADFYHEHLTSLSDEKDEAEGMFEIETTTLRAFLHDITPPENI